MYTTENRRPHKELEGIVKRRTLEPAKLLEGEKELRALQALKSYFVSIASDKHSYANRSLKAKPTSARIFLGRLNPKAVKQSLLNIVKSLQF